MSMRREQDELKAVIQAWKDDYIYLLQSCIAVVPACDAVDDWRMKLFGGDTVSQLLASRLRQRY